MKREWKPGDVAMVTSVNYEITIGLAVGDGEASGWRCEDGRLWGRAYVKDVRLLVVIDPEDREQVGRVLAHYWHSDDPYSESNYPQYLTDLQAALRSLVEPPRPPEPTGLGAVVEDERGERWVRRDESCRPVWVNATGASFPVAYTSIKAVRILSEGVAQ